MTPKRHAPRGPLVQKDPMDGPDPKDTRCTATNRQGKRCGRRPIPGGTVCVMHGGAAPQVKKAAMERLMELQAPAISRLAELLAQKEFPTVAIAAVKDILDRTEGKPGERQQVEHKGTIVIKHEL